MITSNNKLTDIFLSKRNKGKIPFWIDFTTKYYRPYDPGQYLYKQVLDFKGDKFSREFVEMVYTTLISWNMNQRAAKLSDFETFIKSLIDNREAIESLSRYKMGNKYDTENIKSNLKYLFVNLNLVSQEKPKLVTVSKTLHLYLPHLLMPIDRAYTVNFFHSNTYVPKTDEKQFQMYERIFEQFSRFALEYDFKDYLDNKWNQCIPKIIDNLIIGYTKHTSGGQMASR